jgi:glycosyltransferase involved in cell wall biosynthesis
MNYYRHLPFEKMHMDFVVNQMIDPRLKKEIEEKQSEIFLLNRNKRPLRYMRSIYHILKEKQYDVVHVHGNSATMAVDLLPAKLAKVPVRIAHSHSTQCDHKIIHKLLSPFFKSCYTEALACSAEAGERLFGKDGFRVLPNGIEVKKYAYSEDVRDKVRKEFHIEDNFVIGHVGYMNAPKNHKRLFQIFAKLRMQETRAHLLCVTGSETVPEYLQQEIETLGLQKHITILHQRKDVHELLQAVDVFVFPSVFEGFGIALLEAQAVGIPCVVSDVVVRKVDLLGIMQRVSLEESDEVWVEVILSAGKTKVNCRKCNQRLQKSIYDINNCAQQLEKIYECTMYNEKMRRTKNGAKN